MRLIETWLADPERAFDLFAKFPAEETGFENPAAGMDREQFAAYVRGLRDESLGVGLPDGWVPATKYILVNDEGDYVGIFNLLPFPALDGGKVVFLAIEGITGHAVPEKLQGSLTVAAFALLFGLMIFATYNDIIRLITGAV